MTQAGRYDSLFERMLYDSPLHTAIGKIAFALILVATLYLAGLSWVEWLTPLSNVAIIFPSMALAFAGSLIGLAFLRYLDRRNPEPWWFFVGVLVIATFVTAAPAARINNISPVSDLTVGLNEEFWKVWPLLMLVIFAPTVVTGMRDGMIYGAIGGFGFNICEIANYVLRVSYPESGLDGIAGQLTRLGFFGIGNHVVWSTLVGAGIGFAVQTDNRKWKILAPIGAYLLAAFTHTLQDNFVGPLIAIGIELVYFVLRGVNITGITANPDRAKEEMAKLSTSGMWIASPLEVIVINFVNLIILFWAFMKSGDWERKVLNTQLENEVSNEPNAVMTPEEYELLKAEKRLGLRTIPGYSRAQGRAIRNAQSDLAMIKQYLMHHHKPIEGNPLVQYWRNKTVALRNVSHAA